MKRGRLQWSGKRIRSRQLGGPPPCPAVAAQADVGRTSEAGLVETKWSFISKGFDLRQSRNNANAPGSPDSATPQTGAETLSDMIPHRS